MSSSSTDSFVLRRRSSDAPFTRKRVRRKNQTAAFFFSGGFAGVVARCVTSPMDVLKLHMQTHPELQRTAAEIDALQRERFARRQFGSLAWHTVWGNKAQMMRQTSHLIYEQEGLAGFWQGNGVACMRLLPYTGCKFAAFEELKLAFDDFNDDGILGNVPGREWAAPVSLWPTTHPFLSQATMDFVTGACAGVTAVLLTFPLDQVRNRMIVQGVHRGRWCETMKTEEQRKKWRGPGNLWLGNHPADVHAAGSRSGPWRVPYATLPQALRKIIADEGVAGLYRGLPPTLLGVIPCEGGRFASYFAAKNALQSPWARRHVVPEDGLDWRHHLACGWFAGVVAVLLSFPFDVVRKTMMTDRLVLGPEEWQPEGTVRVAKRLWAEQGRRGFFRGVFMHRFKIPVSSSITFVAYECAHDFLEATNRLSMKTSLSVWDEWET